MSAAAGAGTIRLAVVGHTNAGKTSILRTLARDRDFGEVSIRPATTRAVEAVRLDLGEGLSLELDDTPGLEDSIALLDALHGVDADPRLPGPERIARFLQSEAAAGTFAAEAKALRRMLACDLAMYVADAREPLAGKFLDEFVILGWTGKPVLAVLNFVASPLAEGERWRAELQRAGLHNCVAFDSVAFDPEDETRLLRQVAALLPQAEPHAERLIATRRQERTRQLEVAATLIADALLDYGGLHAEGEDGEREIAAAVARREQQLNRDLLRLFLFDEADLAAGELDLRGEEFRLDPFDREVLAGLGLSLGSSAAKGAAAGVAVDLMTGFTSLGAATAIGGAIGAGLDGLNRLRRFAGAPAEQSRLSLVPLETLVFLARRACRLTTLLARRGHAATEALAPPADLSERLQQEDELARLLATCRYQPAWAARAGTGARERAGARLAGIVHTNLEEQV